MALVQAVGRGAKLAISGWLVALLFLSHPITGQGPRAMALAGEDKLLFGVYPGGANGELTQAGSVDPFQVSARLRELRGATRLSVHLYTGWGWYDEGQLESDLASYAAQGLLVTLTAKYSPPPRHAGDIAGYTAFVRRIVKLVAKQPSVLWLFIGNEGNERANPHASDGAFPRADEAIVAGVMAAYDEVERLSSPLLLGINFAVHDAATDAAFLKRLVSYGGPRFHRAISRVGITAYPGVFTPMGPSRDPYTAMRDLLRGARTAMTDADLAETVPIDVMENGFPTGYEDDQAAYLDAFTRSVLDHATEVNVVRYVWFDLWDADTSATDRFAHYGLLRSDLSPKPAFELYRKTIAASAPSPG